MANQLPKRDALNILRQQTQANREIETALDEILAYVLGDIDLPCRIVDDPAADRTLALCKQLKLSRQYSRLL